jgi:23S rRNA (cytosine1962-C5)-methyltransferase
MLRTPQAACRLIHAESDRLPGVVADKYDRTIVVALLSAGAEAFRAQIATALLASTGGQCVFERSDVEVRTLEGLPQRTGVIEGTLPADIEIVEAGLRYGVDVVAGQKTGFYLDQRANRRKIGALARDRRVLNAFCYTGGFTLSALAGGAASVLSIDSSAEALRLARDNLARNPSLDARRASGSTRTCSASCACCATAAAHSTSSCWTRRSSRQPPRTPTGRRVRTRTSTCSR